MNNGYSLCFNEWALDKSIKTELGLLLIISGLTAENGYCFASNEYFSELFEVDPVTISRRINKLLKKGYISITYIKKGNIVVKREIRLTKVLTTVNKSVNCTVNKSVKDNNTSINNTSINREEVKTSNPRQLDLEVEANKILKEEKEKKVSPKKRKRFEVPEVLEIFVHMQNKHPDSVICQFESEKFFNYYESVGWYVGKKKMVNWKAAATNWLKRSKEFSIRKPYTKEKTKSTLQSNLDNANSVLQDAEARVQQLNNEIKQGL